MAFNEYDNGVDAIKNANYFKNAVNNSVLSEDERKIYSSTRKQRDFHFRELVLESYDRKCAICRCPIEAVLQSAHLKGHEVAYSNLCEDRPGNGICLCANHHLMYDKGIIEIDIVNHTIRVSDNKVKEMAWYKEFAAKYNKQIAVQSVG